VNASDRNKVLRDEWLVYALAWGLAPAVFFTFARQVLPTYLAPGMAGLAVATAVGLVRRDSCRRLTGGWIVVALFCGALIVGGPYISEKYSARDMVKVVAASPQLAGLPLSFPMGEPYSGDFYSWKYLGRGMVHDSAVPGVGRVQAEIGRRSRAILLIPRRKVSLLPGPVVSRLKEVAGTRSWAGFTVKGVQ